MSRNGTRICQPGSLVRPGKQQKTGIDVRAAEDIVPIVGVGASAGGIEALEGFFRGMPASPGAGFVVVTHLNPERESVLHEIIARYTSLTVQVAKDGAEV